MNEFGEALLELLEERGMTVPELAEEMREKCCGRTCQCRKLNAWDLSGMMTCRYTDETPHRLMMWHFNLLDDVLGIRRDGLRGGLLDKEDVHLDVLLSDSIRAPVYRPLFERAEELAPAGLLTRETTPEEAAQVLWTHGESLPERLIDLLAGSARRQPGG
jgi:hypothetical protein